MSTHYALALAAALACSSAGAAVYRWVDEDGVTVYSQTAPPAADAVRLEPQAGPSAAEQQAAQERLQQQLEQSSDAAEEKKAAAEERATKKEAGGRRAANCEVARKNLETLQNLGPRMVRTADGEYVRMSEDEVAAGIQKAQQQIKEFCD